MCDVRLSGFEVPYHTSRTLACQTLVSSVISILVFYSSTFTFYESIYGYIIYVKVHEKLCIT